MKTKNEYLNEQGIDLEKELGVSTYTKVRFAMEAYAEDYAQEQVKNCSIQSVSVPFCKCNCQGSESDCSNER